MDKHLRWFRARAAQALRGRARPGKAARVVDLVSGKRAFKRRGETFYHSLMMAANNLILNVFSAPCHDFGLANPGKSVMIYGLLRASRPFRRRQPGGLGAGPLTAERGASPMPRREDWKVSKADAASGGASSDFRLAMAGYGLTTAEIHYRLPDHPSLLQLFVWQQYDLAPEFPTLRKFLGFWEREIEGALHSVRIAHNRLIKPSEWRAVDGVFQLN
jgi:uncharacterized protein Usg